ncbi:MAG: MFS transporter, partial [Promethearchaeota archaeon]
MPIRKHAGQKIIYGLSRMGSSMLLDFSAFFVFYIYFEQFKLDPVFTGVGTMLGKIAIAVGGFVMGYISDRTKIKKLGRRKPYMILGAPLLAFTFGMLMSPFVFMPKDATGLELFAWLAIWFPAFNWMYGFLITPYQALMPEIFDERDRIGASLSENIFNFLSSGVIFVLIPVMINWDVMGADAGSFYQVILVLSLLTTTFYLPAIFILPTPKKFIPHPSYKKELKYVIKNKNFMLYMLFIGVTEAGITIAVEALAGYMDNILSDLTLVQFAILGIIMVISLCGTVIFSIQYSKKKAIHPIMMFGFTSMTLVYPISLIVGRTPGFTFIMAVIFMAAVAPGLAIEYLFQYVVLGNMVEEDEIRTGQSHSGIYHGFLNSPENIFQGLGFLVSGFVMALPNTTVGDKTFTIGYYWYGPVTSIFIGIGVLLLTKIKVDLNKIIEINRHIDIEGKIFDDDSKFVKFMYYLTRPFVMLEQAIEKAKNKRQLATAEDKAAQVQMHSKPSEVPVIKDVEKKNEIDTSKPDVTKINDSDRVISAKETVMPAITTEIVKQEEIEPPAAKKSAARKESTRDIARSKAARPEVPPPAKELKKEEPTKDVVTKKDIETEPSKPTAVPSDDVKPATKTATTTRKKSTRKRTTRSTARSKAAKPAA